MSIVKNKKPEITLFDIQEMKIASWIISVVALISIVLLIRRGFWIASKIEEVEKESRIIFQSTHEATSTFTQPISTKNVITKNEIPSKVSSSTQEIVVHVPILTYHRVRPLRSNDRRSAMAFITTPEALEDDFKFMSDNGYHVVSLPDLVEALHGGHLPEKAVVITFDDGYVDQYTYALPLLLKYHFSASFFIYTDAVSSYHDYMTWEQVRDLNEKGMTIGAHTKSHPKLTKITNKEKVQDEILGSKKVLEAKLSIPVSYFAYPYGLYDDSIIDVVKESGFSVALTVKRGSDHRLKDIYTLKRYDLGSSFSDFKNVLR